MLDNLGNALELGDIVMFYHDDHDIYCKGTIKRFIDNNTIEIKYLDKLQFGIHLSDNITIDQYNVIKTIKSTR